MRRDRAPFFNDHEFVPVFLVLENLTRLAALRLFNERNNRHQELVKADSHAFSSLEPVDSRNVHQMLLSDDAPYEGVSGRCQANPLFALNGAIVIRVNVGTPVGVSQRCAAYVLRRLLGLRRPQAATSERAAGVN